jgi:lysophospholipid acyltransferase (LPLAT)-like uncharacterized protein
MSQLLAPPTHKLRSHGDGLSEKADQFADLSGYPFKERLGIRALDLGFYGLINLIGRTARFEIAGRENWTVASSNGDVVVMTSRSFDGEYISRVLQRFGYGTARGSSTRGAVGAMIEMVRLMRQGRPAAFTIDGPKGPRHIAKIGAVLLAKKTGQPVLPVSITPARFRQISSWDWLQIPGMWTRALAEIAPPIFVPADADEAALESYRVELQAALDGLESRGQRWRAALTQSS